MLIIVGEKKEKDGLRKRRILVSVSHHAFILMHMETI